MSVSVVEMYRFIEWVVTGLLGVILTCWAFFPEEVLEQKLSFFQFPNRYYVLAFGNWFGVSFLYLTFLFYGMSLMASKPKNSYFSMIDRHTVLGKAPKRTQDEQSQSMQQVDHQVEDWSNQNHHSSKKAFED